MNDNRLTAALDAVVDGISQAIVQACARDAQLHLDTQTKSAELVAELALEQALGPELKKFGRELFAAVGARSSQRAAEKYNHPRMSADAAIRDLQDAQTTLQRAIAKAKSETPDAKLAVVLASLRLTAITQALGPDCIVAEKAARHGPQHVRRKPTADDIPPQIKAIIAKMAQGDEDDFEAGIYALGEISGTPQDLGLIATKLLALATYTNGFEHICTIAANVGIASQAKQYKSRPRGEVRQAKVELPTNVQSVRSGNSQPPPAISIDRFPTGDAPGVPDNNKKASGQPLLEDQLTLLDRLQETTISRNHHVVLNHDLGNRPSAGLTREGDDND